MAVRLSEASIVLAIYGPSSVGKSTLANELGRQWAVPVRHCGSVVKVCATEIGVPPNCVPLELHRKIDAETCRLAQDTSGIFVVEGTYLDLVLSKMPQVKLLQLTCDEAMRELRFFAKVSAETKSPATLRQRDQEDTRLRRVLYRGHQPPAENWMVLDTTRSAPAELVSVILARMEQEA